jgi:hypothetical protein
VSKAEELWRPHRRAECNEIPNQLLQSRSADGREVSARALYGPLEAWRSSSSPSCSAPRQKERFSLPNYSAPHPGQKYLPASVDHENYGHYEDQKEDRFITGDAARQTTADKAFKRAEEIFAKYPIVQA